MFENLIRRIKEDYINDKSYKTDEINAMINETDYSGDREATIEDFNHLRLALRQVKYVKWGSPTSIDESDIEEFCIKALLKGKPEFTEEDIGIYLDSLLGKNKARENPNGIHIKPLGIFSEFFHSSNFRNNMQQINTQQTMEKLYRVILKYEELPEGDRISSLIYTEFGDTFAYSLISLMTHLSPELNLKLYEMASRSGNDLGIENISNEERKKHDAVRGRRLALFVSHR